MQDFSRWDWTDADNAIAQRDILPGFRSNLLKLLADARHRRSERFEFPREDRLANAALFALADSSWADDVCRCVAGTWECHQWLACPYCASLDRDEALFRLRPLAEMDRIWALDLTVDGFGLFDSESFLITQAWRDLLYALKVLYDHKVLDGYFWVIGVEPKFWDSGITGGVWPHVHALVVAAHGLDLHAFCRSLQDKVYVRFHLKPITNPRQFKNRVQYPVRAINWAAAYREAWELSGAAPGSESAARLNDFVRTTLEAVELAAGVFRKRGYKGVLDPRSRRYLGASKAKMKNADYQKEVRTWRAAIDVMSEVDVDEK